MLRIYVLCVIATLFCYACEKQPDLSDIQKSLSEIEQQFAPDKRVAIWEVTSFWNGKDIVIKGTTNLADAKHALFDKLQQPYIDSVIVLPDTSTIPYIYGVVNLSTCNIRSKPKHSSELSTQSILGTPLYIYKREGDWYYVQTPDGYLGWLDKGGLVPMTKETFEEWQELEKVVYNQDFGFTYKEPFSNADRVSDVNDGNILAKLEETEVFYKVGYPDKRIAFLPKSGTILYKDWLKDNPPLSTSILSTAQKYLGRPYLWGGTSAKGVDCSGFTKMVFYSNGLLLPRDASQQVQVGTLIETDTTWKNLLPGDLLFFGRKASDTAKERITHVAIYKGNGQIIHAAGQVKEESLIRGTPMFAEERLHTFVKAKRILTSWEQLKLSENIFY